MKKVLLFIVLVLPCVVRGELVTFSPGDPISAAEINQNFSYLDSLVGNAGPKESWVESGAYNASASQTTVEVFQVPAGKSYYLTDLSAGLVISTEGCGNDPLIEVSGSTLGTISYIDVHGIGLSSQYDCFLSAKRATFETPIRLPPGESVFVTITNYNGVWTHVFNGSKVVASGFSVSAQ